MPAAPPISSFSRKAKPRSAPTRRRRLRRPLPSRRRRPRRLPRGKSRQSVGNHVKAAKPQAAKIEVAIGLREIPLICALTPVSLSQFAVMTKVSNASTGCSLDAAVRHPDNSNAARASRAQAPVRRHDCVSGDTPGERASLEISARDHPCAITHKRSRITRLVECPRRVDMVSSRAPYALTNLVRALLAGPWSRAKLLDRALRACPQDSTLIRGIIRRIL